LFIVQVLVVVASPAFTLLLVAISLFLSETISEYRPVFLLALLLTGLRLVSLWRKKPAYAKLSYWLIGESRAVSPFTATALILSRSIDFAEGRNPRYPQLRMAIQSSEQGDSWKISIRNRGWKAVGPIHISSADLSRLIAPGWLEREIVDRAILSEKVQQVDTGILLPFFGITVYRKKVPGFDLASSSVIATFFVHGGTEFSTAMYRIDVEHPDGDGVAPIPGPDRTAPPPPQIRFEYDGSAYIPVLATLVDGTPYSGKATGSEGIADWAGTFVEGRPDGEFSVTLGDRMTVQASYSKGVRIDS
jgi:hypothetical protein